MTKHLMNPVNRHYVHMANLFGRESRLGDKGSPVGQETAFFQGVVTGIHTACSHFTMF